MVPSGKEGGNFLVQIILLFFNKGLVAASNLFLNFIKCFLPAVATCRGRGGRHPVVPSTLAWDFNSYAGAIVYTTYNEKSNAFVEQVTKVENCVCKFSRNKIFV
jgi:hypothetical protein